MKACDADGSSDVCSDDSYCQAQLSLPDAYCRFDCTSGTQPAQGLCASRSNASSYDCQDATSNPVCSCKNQDFATPCDASAAGASIASSGYCRSKGSCASNSDCQPSSFCQFKAGSCSGPGKCVQKPDFCTADFNPVCTCANTTASNQCVAASQGQSLRHYGACGPNQNSTSCKSNEDCKSDALYCKVLGGGCTGKSACVKRPEFCPMNYAPVCSCDGQTCSNACVCASKGENVAHQGPCANK